MRQTAEHCCHLATLWSPENQFLACLSRLCLLLRKKNYKRHC